MIDLSVGVRDLERSVRFYDAVLGALGYVKHDVRPTTVGFGKRYFPNSGSICGRR
jgi:catechol 2,3-dioxygenase-like lactoylglutathione lyase family enzyme